MKIKELNINDKRILSLFSIANGLSPFGLIRNMNNNASSLYALFGDT